MKIGDLVKLWINKKKVGIIASEHSWGYETLFEVQWADGTRYRHRAKDLEVL